MLSLRRLTRLGFSFLLLCCARSAPEAVHSNLVLRHPDHDLHAAIAGLRVGEPLIEGGLAIFPLYSTGASPCHPDLLEVGEAMQKGHIHIREVEGGGRVSELEIESKAPKPVLIPFGAILTGGKQDRTVAIEVLLQPEEKRRIPVLCIEQGRWSSTAPIRLSFCSNTPASTSTGTLGQIPTSSRPSGSEVESGTGDPLPDPQSLTFPGSDRSDEGGTGSERIVFIKCANSLSLKGKTLVTGGESQSEVWLDVNNANAIFNNDSTTANFQGNFKTPRFIDAQRRFAILSSRVKSRRDVRGILVVLDGSFAGMEVYPSPDFFAISWDRLFNSIVIDAARSAESPTHTWKTARAEARKALAELAESSIDTSREGSAARLKICGRSMEGAALLTATDPSRLLFLRWYSKHK